jgi:hypothetical protein
MSGSARVRESRVEVRKQSVGYHCASVGNGVDDEFEIHHNLNCPFPIVQLDEAATIGSVTRDYRILDTNTIHLSFRRRPDTDEFVVIMG